MGERGLTCARARARVCVCVRARAGVYMYVYSYCLLGDMFMVGHNISGFVCLMKCMLMWFFSVTSCLYNAASLTLVGE